MDLTQLTLDKSQLVVAGDSLLLLHSPEQKQEPGRRGEQWGLLSIQCFTVWSWLHWREAQCVMPGLTSLANGA